MTEKLNRSVPLTEIMAGTGRCEICDTALVVNPSTAPQRFMVDHDHATGEFRGVLCRGCNVGLGSFRDSTTLMEAAIKYLQRHNTQPRSRTILKEVKATLDPSPKVVRALELIDDPSYPTDKARAEALKAIFPTQYSAQAYRIFISRTRKKWRCN